MAKLDIEMKRTDELLYQMISRNSFKFKENLNYNWILKQIPKKIADLLRGGETALDKTCEVSAPQTTH
jgi:hypothetical protein